MREEEEARTEDTEETEVLGFGGWRRHGSLATRYGGDWPKDNLNSESLQKSLHVLRAISPSTLF